MADLKIYAEDLEQAAAEQIAELCALPAFEDSKVRIMADAHAGKGCVIGFTAKMGLKVIPNVVGVDIGCGVLAVRIDAKADEAFFKRLDAVIRERVPSGRSVHAHRLQRVPSLQHLHCLRDLKDTKRIERALGTLGGGNHFIEVDVSQDGGAWLVIHTGSRNLGKQVAEHYQRRAIDAHKGDGRMEQETQRIIADYKAAGRESEIQEALANLRNHYAALKPSVKPDLCWLEDVPALHYLDDMRICQSYAAANRLQIAITMLDALNVGYSDIVESVHNYIDHENGIIRKGAISAYEGQRVIIPLNMAAGCVLGIGKGNADYNYSAPHGAGRAMSRTAARKRLNVGDYAAQMTAAGVWSSCVGESTIDEAPAAYKPAQGIVDGLKDTVDVVEVLRPVYNFKASE